MRSGEIATALRTPAKVLDYAGAYMFHKRTLAALLGVPARAVSKIYAELRASGFPRAMAESSGHRAGLFRMTMLSPFRAPALYAAVRVLKPEMVVETGVANGFSSAFLLKALEDNGRGRLVSIDYPNQPGQSIEKETGWLVPRALRGRWELLLGPSSELLPTLVARLPRMDMFYHDSDHSYSNMTFEYGCAWPRLAAGGALLSDDVTDNAAFRDFTAGRNCRAATLFKLGIAIKIA